MKIVELSHTFSIVSVVSQRIQSDKNRDRKRKNLSTRQLSGYSQALQIKRFLEETNSNCNRQQRQQRQQQQMTTINE